VVRYRLFFFSLLAYTDVYPLSLHDALPIFLRNSRACFALSTAASVLSPSESSRSRSWRWPASGSAMRYCRELIGPEGSRRVRQHAGTRHGRRGARRPVRPRSRPARGGPRPSGPLDRQVGDQDHALALLLDAHVVVAVGGGEVLLDHGEELALELLDVAGRQLRPVV